MYCAGALSLPKARIGKASAARCLSAYMRKGSDSMPGRLFSFASLCARIDVRNIFEKPASH
ncbi:hypothetical protein TAMA11512_01290 [Selenomonas sp. TAMA-11512]|nr:hypothetical protein TAMA11512_01290 [Selenomonas sp. TAMA-11512]